MREDALDDALDELEGYGPEFRGYLSNHGPMAAEALCRLGRHDAVRPWIESYVSVLEPRPAPRERVVQDNWRQALGDRSRFADWSNFFHSELEDADWRGVVRDWAARLAPGLSGSATHGLIRSCHAVRAMVDRETNERRQELADALAYWASGFQSLPVAPSPARYHRASEAVQHLPLLEPSDQARRGWEQSVAAIPEFGAAVNLLDLDSQDDAEAISGLTETFATLYVLNAALPGRVVIPIHAVTSASAIRALLPLVAIATARDLIRFVWQAGAAIVTAYAVNRTPREAELAPHAWENLIDRAVATQDEHAIKFTEACKREHAISGADIFKVAAADACSRLSNS